MAIAIDHETELLSSSGADAQLVPVDADVVGVIIQNLGTGRVYYTLDNSTPSPINGHVLEAGELLAMVGAAWAEAVAGLSLLTLGIKGNFLGGSDAGGADPDNARVQITIVTNPP